MNKVEKIENNAENELKKEEPKTEPELSDQDLDGVVGGRAAEKPIITSVIPMF